MCDPTGEHITRIHINCSRQTPSPIRSKKTVPVCTSTPIINVPVCDPSSKQQMNLIAKEVLANQRATSETFIRKTESPPAPPRPQIDSESLVFISKETGQQIDLNTGEGIGKIIQPNSGTITKKKKQQRQSLAVVPPTGSTRKIFFINSIRLSSISPI